MHLNLHQFHPFHLILSKQFITHTPIDISAPFRVWTSSESSTVSPRVIPSPHLALTQNTLTLLRWIIWKHSYNYGCYWMWVHIALSCSHALRCISACKDNTLTCNFFLMYKSMNKTYIFMITKTQEIIKGDHIHICIYTLFMHTNMEAN